MQLHNEIVEFVLPAVCVQQRSFRPAERRTRGADLELERLAFRPAGVRRRKLQSTIHCIAFRQYGADGCRRCPVYTDVPDRIVRERIGHMLALDGHDARHRLRDLINAEKLQRRRVVRLCLDIEILGKQVKQHARDRVRHVQLIDAVALLGDDARRRLVQKAEDGITLQ